MRRRQHRARFFVIDDDVVRRAPGPALVEMEVGEELRHAISLLDPALREAFLLKHVEQLSYDEMHAITGASIPALKMRVKRACERLRLTLRHAMDA
jgi:RNA polymerase sigma-70 factor (ECF subfamily)